MRRTLQSTLIELFPPNEFNRDWETVVRTMGIRYIAWQGNQCVIFPSLPLLGGLTNCMIRKYTSENLPEFSQSPTYEDFALDAQAVIRSITEDLNVP